MPVEGSAGTIPLIEFPPVPGTPVGKRLMLLTGEGVRTVFHGPAPIYVFDAQDRAAASACMAMLSRTGLAHDVDIAAAFGVHRNTVARLAARLEQAGLAGVVPAKRGPKGPSKVNAKVRAIIAHNGGLSSAELVRLVRERTGRALSPGHVRRLRAGAGIEQPELTLTTDASATDEQVPDTASASPGVGSPAPAPDPAVAFDPPAQVPEHASGRSMGVALYYPALVALGLLDAARSHFRLPRSARIGVRATFLTLFFLTLLGKSTLESAKHLTRRSFGAVVGCVRAPCVKTLRRKLAELCAQQATVSLGETLSRLWVRTGLVATAYLYVDGHVKEYTGKRKLQEVWNAQRRMPLPGVISYFVGDQQGRPLLFINDGVCGSLSKSMPRIVAAIREVIGDASFTVVFDRGGYDGKLFDWLVCEGIGFITYQRGSPGLPADRFTRREARFEGKRIRFHAAEDEVKVGKSGPWRRIVVRTPTGHQTPILTSIAKEAVGTARIACLMFARWRQENFFRYMGAHHGLDQLVSYAAVEAPDQMIPNPERTRLAKQIAALRKQAAELRAEVGDAVLNEPRQGRSAHGIKVAQKGAVKKLRQLDSAIAELVATRKAAPTHVAASESGQLREAMRLEHKTLLDRIKITAYNAEEWMLDRLQRHYTNPNDIRDLLRSFADLSGEMRATRAGVVVTLDAPDTPIHRRALRALCEDLNAEGATFPGTTLPVAYRVSVHHSEKAA
jgi:transposase